MPLNGWLRERRFTFSSSQATRGRRRCPWRTLVDSRVRGAEAMLRSRSYSVWALICLLVVAVVSRLLAGLHRDSRSTPQVSSGGGNRTSWPAPEGYVWIFATVESDCILAVPYYKEGGAAHVPRVFRLGPDSQPIENFPLLTQVGDFPTGVVAVLVREEVSTEARLIRYQRFVGWRITSVDRSRSLPSDNRSRSPFSQTNGSLEPPLEGVDPLMHELLQSGLRFMFLQLDLIREDVAAEDLTRAASRLGALCGYSRRLSRPELALPQYFQHTLGTEVPELATEAAQHAALDRASRAVLLVREIERRLADLAVTPIDSDLKREDERRR